MRLICIYFVFCLFLSSNAYSDIFWKIQDELIPYVDVDSTYNQIPKITSADDVENLLTILHKFYPFESLQADFDGTLWIISGKPGKKIRKIEMDFVTRKVKNAINIEDDFFGKIDSKETQSEILKKVQKNLEKLSFFDASCSLKKKEDVISVDYFVECDEGFSYRIQETNSSLVSFLKDDLCDEKKIEQKIEEAEEEYRKQGFFDCQFSLRDIFFQKEKKTCIVNIDDDLGLQMKFSIVENKKEFGPESSYMKKILDSTNLSNDPFSVRDELTQFYLSQGYRNVKVSKPFMVEKDVYRFEVETGEIFKIRKIEFQGNQFLSHEDLIKEMHFQNFWNVKQNYVKQDILNGITLLEKKYKENGFWNIHIEYPLIREAFDSNECDLTFFIKEGSRRILNMLTVAVEGQSFFEKEKILEHLDAEFNKGLDQSQIQMFKEKIETMYLSQGFLYVESSFEWTQKNDQENIYLDGVFKIKEGTRVRIGSVNFTGLSKTHSDVLLREVKFRPGDWYLLESIDETRKNLINLGVFKFVQIHIVEYEQKKSDQVDLMIEVRESSSAYVTFGPGFDIKKGLNYSMNWNWNNISGKNRQLGLKLGVSEEKNQTIFRINHQSSLIMDSFIGRKIQMNYKEPYMFVGGKIDGVVELSHKGTAEQIISLQNTLRFGILRQFSHLGTPMALSYLYNFKDQDDRGSLPQTQLLVSTGKSQIGSLSAYYQVDYRDSLEWTTSGFFSSLEVEYAHPAFFGEYHFVRYDGKYSHHLSLFREDLVLKMSMFLQCYNNLPTKNTKVLPASSRLPAGGTQLVRGFLYSLGPYVQLDDKNHFLDGTRRFIYKSEIRHKMTKKLSAGLFFDMGNSFLPKDEEKKFQSWYRTNKITSSIKDNFNLFEDWSSPFTKSYGSYGLSLGFMTPLGSLNLDLSWGAFEPKGKILTRKSQKSQYPVFGFSIASE